ncbi:MAG TPA: hypothetical protein VGM78_16375, partial [Ilumatobacteraceae bacterium]
VFRVITSALRQSDYFKVTSFNLTGSLLPGVVFLLLWAASAVVAWRLRHRLLVHLHAVIGVSLLLGVVAMARIFGKVWYYLTFWAWGVLALASFAIVWTAASAVRRARTAWVPQMDRAFTFASLGVLGVSTLAFSFSAAHLKPPENYLSRPITALAGPTADALARGDGAADGKSGRYVVTFSDVAYFGSQAYGLVNELDRRGFHAGMPPYWYVPITAQRVIDPATATAEVHLATGSSIASWEAKPGVVEVGSYDPRNASQLARYNSLRSTVVANLDSLGLADLVPDLDSNLFGVQLDPRVPARVQDEINSMLLLGQPTAVFIAPPGTTPS